MDFLNNLGFTTNELLTLLLLVVVGIIAFMVLRFVLKVTRTILRWGCFTIFLLGAAIVLYFWFT